MSKNSLLKILYVEDANENREYIEKILRREFSNIDIAIDGLDGLEKFKENDYDVIVSDIKMPKLDGISMIEAIKAIKPSIYTIFLTAHNDSEYLIRGIDLKVDKYLIKPLKIRELLSTLENYSEVLENKRLLKTQEKVLKDYKNVIDNSLIVSKCDKNGVINYVNDMFCEVSGFTKEEMIGCTHNKVHHVLMDRDKFKDMWNDILSGKTHKIRIRDKNKQGESYWIDSFIYPVKDEDGEIEEIISVSKNVTLEVLQAKEIAEIEAKEKRSDIKKAITISKDKILQYLPIASIIIENGVIVGFNEFFEELVLLNLSHEIYNSLLYGNLKANEIFGNEFEFELFTDINENFTFENSENKYLIKSKKIDDEVDSLVVSFIDVK